MKLPGIQHFRHADRTAGADGAGAADTSSKAKPASAGLRKFGTQVKRGVREAVKNLNAFSNKLSGKVHDVPGPVVEEAVQHARAGLRRQEEGLRRQGTAHHAGRPHHAAQPQQAARAQHSAEAEWELFQAQCRIRQREVNDLKFDMLRRHPGELRLETDIIPPGDKEALGQADAIEKRISAAEMKLNRYVRGDAQVDVKAALRDIRAAEDGLQHLLRGVRERERAARAAPAAARHETASEGPSWDRTKVPAWDRDLRRRVDDLMKEYYADTNHEDNYQYQLTEAQRELAKMQLDDIFNGIAERERTEQRLMRNLRGA